MGKEKRMEADPIVGGSRKSKCLLCMIKRVSHPHFSVGGNFSVNFANPFLHPPLNRA